MFHHAYKFPIAVVIRSILSNGYAYRMEFSVCDINLGLCPEMFSFDMFPGVDIPEMLSYAVCLPENTGVFDNINLAAAPIGIIFIEENALSFPSEHRQEPEPAANPGPRLI